MKSRVLQALYRILINMAVVGLAVTVAQNSYRSFYMIPRSLIELSKVVMGKGELTYFFTLVLICVYVVTTLVILASRRLVSFDGKALVLDTYALFVATTLAVSLYFVATEKNFSPNFFVQFLGLAFLFRLGAFGAASALTGAVQRSFSMLVKQLASPFGLVTVFVVLLPGLLLGGYKKDRRIANLIHSTRRAISQTEKIPYDVKPLQQNLFFEQPIEVEFDSQGNMYVLERVGRLFMLKSAGSDQESQPAKLGQSDGPLELQKFLLADFSKQVGKVAVENGALGFALHPDFGNPGSPDSNRFFVAYTHWDNSILKNRLSEFLVNENLLDQALTPDQETASESENQFELAASAVRESILIEQTRASDGYHNAGAVEFGPDGFLYIAVGEATEKKNHQQIDYALYSGILRIDIDNQAESLPISKQPPGGITQGYKIPQDNPFVVHPGALQEFYALGFRNPFRISFDKATGKLWAGDVGNITYEEINIVEPGGNYQFPYAEGPKVGKKPVPLIGSEKRSYFYYVHTALNRAIIGGEVYRGIKFNDLRGRYIYGDNYSGRIMMIPAQGHTWSDEAKTIALLPHLGQMGLTSLRQGPDGEMYFTSLGQGGSRTGRVWQLTKQKQDNSKDLKLAKSQRPSMPPHQLFKQYCSRCHGLKGEGKAEVSAALKVEMANFQSAAWQEKSSLSYIQKVILNGGEKMGLNAGMPAWSSLLTERQAFLLADYVKQLGRGNAQKLKGSGSPKQAKDRLSAKPGASNSLGDKGGSDRLRARGPEGQSGHTSAPARIKGGN